MTDMNLTGTDMTEMLELYRAALEEEAKTITMDNFISRLICGYLLITSSQYNNIVNNLTEDEAIYEDALGSDWKTSLQLISNISKHLNHEILEDSDCSNSLSEFYVELLMSAQDQRMQSLRTKFTEFANLSRSSYRSESTAVIVNVSGMTFD